MILGIMQPYFFPYLEYFRLIHHCDHWLVFDTAQYTRKSWMNRNRIINREKGWSYLSVPVQHEGKHFPIRHARIVADSCWRDNVLDRLRVYQHEAPHYNSVNAMIRSILSASSDNLAELNLLAIRSVCSYLGIATPIQSVSELNLDLPERCEPGEWALQIAKRVGATEYRNPSGGVSLFDECSFKNAGIKLAFHEHRRISYDTGSFTAVENLSVIDVLMWNAVEKILVWLK